MSGTARRLVESFVTRHGCVEGTVPEAHVLTTACDVILTRDDGMAFSMVCVVDAENHDTKTFDADSRSACRMRRLSRRPRHLHPAAAAP
jgi:hypothetical protein